MANISQIKLPDNTEYDLKDKSGTISSHLHHDEDLVPLVSKTYTNVVATANNFAGGWFFYGKLLPTDFYTIYKIHYRITSIAAGRNDAKTVCDVWICGTQSSLLAYASFNRIANTSYLAQHHNELYRATSAGITGGYGHLIGVRLQSAWNPTTAANSRTITIDILEVENCTFTFFENMTLYANVPGTGSTNYTAYTEVNGTSNGLQETGDADNVDNIMAYFNLKTGAQGIWNTSLIMQDGNGCYQNICTASDGTATNANRTTANTKLANPNGFRVGGTIYYSAGNYNANANITSWGHIRSMQGNVFDARYSFNVTLTANSLTPYAPIYLVGTINATDGLFYLDQIWWTQTPNDTNKIYVLVGGCYDSTTSNCRISLLEHNPWYKYDGSKLVELTNGHIVNKDVPANAAFTDTTYESKQEAESGTAVSLATTGEKYNWNHGIETALVHKEYNGTNVYVVSGDADTQGWYFMSVRPDSYGASWSVKCRVLSYCANNPEQRTDTLMEISQTDAQTPIEGCSRNYQTVSFSHYRIIPRRVTSAGYTAGYGQAIGILINSGNYGPESYRTIIVDIFRCENCSVTLLNTPVKWSEWTGASAENYIDYSSYASNISLYSNGYISSVTNKVYVYGFSGSSGLMYLALLSGYKDQSVGINHCFGVNPDNGYMQIAREHTSTTSVDSGLWCGNNIPDGTAGAVRGVLNLFAANGSANYIVPAENNGDRLYFLPTVGSSTTLAATEKTIAHIAGVAVDTLDAFVNLLSNYGNGRSFSGTIKITTDIGVGISANNWTRVFMMAQNPPNNGNYDIGLFALFFPNDSSLTVQYAIVQGLTTGNYTVQQKGDMIWSAGGEFTGQVNHKALLSVSTSGNGQLNLGNNLASGATGKSQGRLVLYSSSAYYADLKAASLTGSRNLLLPDKSGTLACTSDIVDANVKRNNTSTNASYRVLYSYNANDSSDTSQARSGRLIYNPGLGRLIINSVTNGMIEAPSNQLLYLRASNEANFAVILGVRKNGSSAYWALAPESDGGTSYGILLGGPNYRWGQIYSTNSAISTSDRNEKKDIEPLDESARDFIMALNPVSYKYINGKSDRTHYGMIAQDVEEEMAELGMTAKDFGGFCKDQKTVPYMREENGVSIKDDMPVEGEYRYGLRYEEFVAPMIKTIQMQQQEIDELKSELAEIKALLLNK